MINHLSTGDITAWAYLPSDYLALQPFIAQDIVQITNRRVRCMDDELTDLQPQQP